MARSPPVFLPLLSSEDDGEEITAPQQLPRRPQPSPGDMDIEALAQHAANCIPSLRFIHVSADYYQSGYWDVRRDDGCENSPMLTKVDDEEGQQRVYQSLLRTSDD